MKTFLIVSMQMEIKQETVYKPWFWKEVTASVKKDTLIHRSSLIHC